MEDGKFRMLVDFLEILHERKDPSQAVVSVAESSRLTESQERKILEIKRRNEIVQKYRKKAGGLRRSYSDESSYDSVQAHAF